MKRQSTVAPHSHAEQDEVIGNAEITAHHENHETGGGDAIAALAGEVLTSGTVNGDRLPAISTTKKGAVPAVTAGATELLAKFLKDTGLFARIVQANCDGLLTTDTPQHAGLGIGVAGESNAIALAEGARMGPAAGIHAIWNLAATLLQLLGGDVDIGDTPTQPGTGGTWSTSYDSAGTKIHCLALFQGKLYAGSEEGVLYVYDGSSWSMAKDFTPATKITALCVFNNKLYACGYLSSSGVNTYVYSTANGTDWSTVWSNNWGYIVEGILSMAVHDNTLYIGLTQSGVYYSTDGESFSTTSLASGYGASGLGVFDGSLYAATNNIATGGTRIYKLGTGGWSLVYTADAGINLTCIYPWNGKLYAGTDTGQIFASADGASWSEVEDLGSMSVLCFQEYGGLLLAGCDNGTIYQSSDGFTWSSFYASGTASVRSILEYGGDLFAATGDLGKVQVYVDNTYIPAPNLQVFGHLRLWGQFRPGDAPGVEGDILLSGGADHASWLARGTDGQYIGGVTDGKPVYRTIPASDVVFTSAGNIEATDLQAAVVELDGEKGPVPITKTDTGDPASGIEGQVCVNTYDKTVKIYGGSAWRTVATWT